MSQLINELPAQIAALEAEAILLDAQAMDLDLEAEAVKATDIIQWMHLRSDADNCRTLAESNRRTADLDRAFLADTDLHERIRVEAMADLYRELAQEAGADGDMGQAMEYAALAAEYAAKRDAYCPFDQR